MKGNSRGTSLSYVYVCVYIYMYVFNVRTHMCMYSHLSVSVYFLFEITFLVYIILKGLMAVLKNLTSKN